MNISNQIRKKSNFEEFENLKAIVKTRLENPKLNVKLQCTYNRSIEELKSILKANITLIEGSIIFEEFLKEYLSIFDSKTELIKLMSIYEDVHREDLVLDTAIRKLTKVKKVHL